MKSLRVFNVFLALTAIGTTASANLAFTFNPVTSEVTVLTPSPTTETTLADLLAATPFTPVSLGADVVTASTTFQLAPPIGFAGSAIALVGLVDGGAIDSISFAMATEVLAGTEYDVTGLLGTSSLNGGSVANLIPGSSGTATGTPVNNIAVAVTAVPEPSAFLYFAMIGMPIGLVRRYRQS